MSNNFVSIIVPCYNQAIYLSEALESVLNQTYLDWECIIVNDGSSDNTDEVVREWLKKDSRFKYIKKENGGLSNARNSGIEACNGYYVLPLDADDKIASNYIAMAIDAFLQNKFLKLVYCKAEKFGDESGLWDLKPFSLHELSRNNMIFPAAMFKKQDWKDVNGYDSNMTYGWEDWEFWIALLKNGGEVKQLDIVGFYYRIKSESMLKSIDNKKARYLLNYLSVKHADFFVKYYGSFKEMEEKSYFREFDFKQKLASKKFILHMFFKTFFKFSLFKKYEQ